MRLFLPLIHGLCAFFRPLLTPLSTAPFFASLSIHGLHFTVYAPSNFYFDKSLSKCRRAIGPKDAMMHAHTLSLSTWAWRRLCDVLSAPDSGDGIGYPLCAYCCVTPEHLFCQHRNVKEISAESLRRNLPQKSAHKKSAHKNSAQNSVATLPPTPRQRSRCNVATGCTETLFL